MINFRKPMFVCIVIFLLAGNPVFSQNQLENLQSSVDKFTDSFAQSLPFYSTMGLNWSDAYIGQLIAMPPHFGVGISAGAVTMKFDSMNDLMSMFNLGLPVAGGTTFLQDIGLLLPGYTAEIRLGGIILPFDIGIKVSYIVPGLFNSVMELFQTRPDFDLKNTLIGADIRYALFNPKVLPVKISVGAGFNYLDGGISASIPELPYSFEDSSGNQYTLAPTDPRLDIEWKTVNLELKTQVSFPFKIITPYIGVGVSYAWSQAGYRVNTPELLLNGGVLSELEELLLNEFGLTGVSDTGFETIKKINSFNSRAFGGLSFNLAFIRFDFTAMYNFTGNNFGATFGLRFQL